MNMLGVPKYTVNTVSEAGAHREKKKCSTTVRAPEASTRQQKRSTAVLEPEASTHQEKCSAAVHAPVLSTAAVERSMRANERRGKKLLSGSGVVAKQKKTIDLSTSSSDESSSCDESTQLRLVEQLKGKEKKVSKHSLMDSSRPGFVIGFLFFIVVEYACQFSHSFCLGKLI
jgi:hypothetical protein